MDVAGRAVLARTLQHAGNAAATRYLARQPQTTLKQKVEHARRTDPSAYVLSAVRGMAAAGTWTFEEQAAEITWRMIWMFLPGRINNTLVRADPNARGVELSPSAPRGFAELVVGPNFIKGITAKNLPDRVAILPLVLLGKDAIVAKLKADFGFDAIVDGSSTWTGGELAVTHVGLSKMPQADRAALSGVTLRRERALTHDGRPADGVFEFDVSAVTAGSSTPPTLTQVLKLADSAFSDLDQASEVVVHEAGHAVDSDKRRRAQLAAATAVAAENVTINTLNNAAQAAGNALNGAINRFNSYLPADRTAANAFLQSMMAAHNAINNFAFHSTAANQTALENTANAAVATRNTRRAALPANNPADGDFATASDLQDDWLAAATAFVTARAAKVRAQAAVAAASGTTNTGISRRLERFRAIVVRHNIAPITPYARQNWPAHPEEFFAEAYTMWRHDPSKLERLARPLKTFFDDDEHLK
jgi:hypothetical protein